VPEKLLFNWATRLGLLHKNICFARLMIIYRGSDTLLSLVNQSRLRLYPYDLLEYCAIEMNVMVKQQRLQLFRADLQTALFYFCTSPCMRLFDFSCDHINNFAIEYSF